MIEHGSAPVDGHTVAIEPAPVDLARVGFEMFTRASIRFPASISTQGASIASESRAQDLNLKDVSVALAISDKYILDAVNATNKLHVERGARVNTITPVNIIDIVIADFDMAETLSPLTPEKLQEIMDFYNQRRAEGRRVNERILRQNAMQILAEASRLPVRFFDE